VQAHSLVRNWDGLLRLSDGGFDAQLDVTGNLKITRHLPADEEVFESLASRVRPLTVKSEPVYYVTVFDEIEQVLAAVEVDESLRSRALELRRAWIAAEIQGTQVQTYAMQSVRLDGTEGTNIVSDTQLAAAWLYADLVHADAKGAKKQALALPLRERYAAAVRVFSRMAALTVATLQLVTSLQDAGVLSIAESVWEGDVVVGTSELVEDARAYFAPVGGEMPDLRDSLELGDEWSAFTITELLRQDPANQVRVALRDEKGQTVDSYDAAVLRRQPDGTSFGWNVLVAGSVIFKFCFDLHGDQLAGARFLGWEAFDSTNQLKFASTRLLLQLHDASIIAFQIGEHELLTLDPPSFSEDERLELEVVGQIVEDIVTIERLSGRTVGPSNGRFDDRHRVHLRRARLMLEGEIVHAMRHPVIVTVPDGNPPQAIVVAAGTLDVGGTAVPIPAIAMRHPNMTAVETGSAPDVGPEARTYRMTPPKGEQFLAWVPGLSEVSGDDDLVATTRWGLIGIDEETFIY